MMIRGAGDKAMDARILELLQSAGMLIVGGDRIRVWAGTDAVGYSKDFRPSDNMDEAYAWCRELLALLTAMHPFCMEQASSTNPSAILWCYSITTQSDKFWAHSPTLAMAQVQASIEFWESVLQRE